MPRLPFVTLASGSPRRRQLLTQIGINFEIVVPRVEERHLPGESPAVMVERLALEKALAVADGMEGGIVLGSDTTVALHEHVLEKPVDAADAIRMLKMLSGNTHTVYTGFALVEAGSGKQMVSHEATQVTFRTLAHEEIEEYVATGSPLDKAGAYGIQDDFGAVFIERIEGDYYTVVGLPLARVYVALRDFS